MFDLYGPSEDTTYSTYALRQRGGPATTGRPLANTKIYNLDPHLHSVPAGVLGALGLGWRELGGCVVAGVVTVFTGLSVLGLVGLASLARAQTLSIKQRDHVQAARALGTSTTRIALRHILPLLTAPLLVQITFELAGTIIAESTLSFLGIGVQPPDASWGSMIRDGMRYMLIAPHVVLAPGVAIFLVVMSINMFGDRLRDRLDVRIKP